MTKEELHLKRALEIWEKVHFSEEENLLLNVTRFHDLLGMEEGAYAWPDETFISVDTAPGEA
jgi:hypothetical protein